ncbi:MAG: putative GH25 family protein [Glaciecola sp.]|jgi:uncharacterized GH25 family protein
MRPTIKLSIGLLACLSAANVFAHDFWLSPTQFQSPEAPVTIPTKFLVGHAEEVDSWNLNWDRIVALRTYGNNEYNDQMPGIVASNVLNAGFANVKLNTKGTHVLGFESYHSFSSLAGEKFNSYAEKEGLALVLEQRKRLNQEQDDGRELYSRKAKAIIQVGDVHSNNVLKPIGHTLEIVPLQHPYANTTKDTIPVQVLFRGKPLENALIDMMPINGTKGLEQASRTDGNGQATFDLVRQGTWKLNVIWAVPNPGNQQAEFETYFTSLTFGY